MAREFYIIENSIIITERKKNNISMSGTNFVCIHCNLTKLWQDEYLH